MKLYGTLTSPYTRHCRVVLRSSDIDCEFVVCAPADMVGISPTARIPYLEAGSVKLSDSTSILKYLRDQTGAPFLESPRDHDLYCLSNTVLDSAICLFLIKKLDGLEPAQSQYLARQAARVESGLDELEARELPLTLSGGDTLSSGAALPLGDAEIRLASLLEWGLFRHRFSLENRPRLRAFLSLAQSWDVFRETAPPADS